MGFEPQCGTTKEYMWGKPMLDKVGQDKLSGRGNFYSEVKKKQDLDPM